METLQEEGALRAWHFKQLRWALQGLAAAGSEQPALFPDAASSADDLAFDFDHWVAVVRSRYEPELADSQAQALAAIEARLSTMSRDGSEFDAELWTDVALRTSERWAEVRRLAAAALEAFAWRERAQ